MGKLLQQAVEEASKLPLLAELRSERRWDELFARSPELLSELAAEAIREDEARLTKPLDFESL